MDEHRITRQMTTTAQPDGRPHSPPLSLAARAGRLLTAAPRWFARRVHGIVARAVRNDVTAVASQFAYNAFLATVPFLLVLVSIVGLLPGSVSFRPLVRDYGEGLPTELSDLLLEALSSATENAGRTAVVLALALLGAMWLAANVIGVLIGGIDHARGVRHRPFLRGKLVAIGFAFAFGLVIAVGTLALVGGPQLIDEVSRRLTGSSDGASQLAQRLVFGIGLLTFFLGTLMLYLVGSAATRRRWAVEVPGALLATAGWLLATRVFGFYVDRFDSIEVVYGALGAVVVYLIFLWLTGLLVVIGAEINQELVEDRGSRHAAGRPTATLKTVAMPAAADQPARSSGRRP